MYLFDIFKEKLLNWTVYFEMHFNMANDKPKVFVLNNVHKYMKIPIVLL